MKKRLLFITGRPGIGKTTVLRKCIEVLEARGYSVGGMISREVRKHGARVGFEVSDLGDGRRGWLAHVEQKRGPKVGKYRVNLGDLNAIGAHAITNAVEEADIVVIDEVGPMELRSEHFKQAVKRAVESRKLVIGTLHRRARDELILEIRGREDAEIYTVTYENRGNLHQTIGDEAAEFLAQTKKE